MTQSQWTDLVAWMCELWPHAPIEPGTANAWWPFVAHLDVDAARTAIATCALEPGRRFPPGVGDIVAAAEQPARDWWDAWLEVHDACAGGKGRVNTDSDDPAVREFVGQLSEWREQVDEGSPTLRAQFRDFYRSWTAKQGQEERTELAANVAAKLGPGLNQIGQGPQRLKGA